MSTLVASNRLGKQGPLSQVRDALRQTQNRELLFWWALAFNVITLCAVIRGFMDDIGLPAHGAEIEGALFGQLPSLWLQHHVYPLSPAVFSWSALAVHASWFVVPWLIAMLVSWKRPHRLGSFFLWWFALHFGANLFFVLFPLRPPWMANPDTIRIIQLHVGSAIPDNNSLAAMPSLHVALPLLISLWLLRERWNGPALAMLAYTAVIAFEVVFSGEHYVIDVAGGVVAAGAIALAVRFDAPFSHLAARFAMALRLRTDGRGSKTAARDGEVISGEGLALASRPMAIFAVTAMLVVLSVAQVALGI